MVLLYFWELIKTVKNLARTTAKKNDGHRTHPFELFYAKFSFEQKHFVKMFYLYEKDINSNTDILL